MDKLIILIVAIIIVFCAIPYVFMLLWNWLVTDIFQLREIVFLEALGLLFMSGLLFKTSNLKYDRD